MKKELAIQNILSYCISPFMKNKVSIFVHTYLPNAKVVFDSNYSAPASIIQYNGSTTVTFCPLKVVQMLCPYCYTARYLIEYLNKIISTKSEDVDFNFRFSTNDVNNLDISSESLYIYLAAHELFHKKSTLAGSKLQDLLKSFAESYPKIPMKLSTFILNVVEDSAIQRINIPDSCYIIKDAFMTWQPRLQGVGKVDEYLNSQDVSMFNKLYFFIVYFYSQSSKSSRQQLVSFVKNQFGMPDEIINCFNNCVSINDSHDRAYHTLFDFVPLVYDWFLVPAVNNAKNTKAQAKDLLECSNIVDPDTIEDDEDEDYDSDESGDEDNSSDVSDDNQSNDNSVESSEDEDYNGDESSEDDNVEDDNVESSEDESEDESDTDTDTEDVNENEEDESESESESESEGCVNENEDGSESENGSESEDINEEDYNKDDETSNSNSAGDGDSEELTENELNDVIEELNNSLEDSLASLNDNDIDDVLNSEDSKEDVDLSQSSSYSESTNLSDIFDESSISQPCDIKLLNNFYDNCSMTFEDLINDGEKTFYHLEEGTFDTDRVSDTVIYKDIDVFYNTEIYATALNMRCCFILDASGSMFYSYEADRYSYDSHSVFALSASVITSLKQAFFNLNVLSRCITFSDEAYILSDYDKTFNSLEELYNTISYYSLPGLDGGTHLDRALSIELNDYDLLAYGNNKLIIILTDGDTSKEYACMSALESLHNEGVEILAVYLGDSLSDSFQNLFGQYDTILCPANEIETHLAGLIYNFIIDKFMLVK